MDSKPFSTSLHLANGQEKETPIPQQSTLISLKQKSTQLGILYAKYIKFIDVTTYKIQHDSCYTQNG